MTPTTRGPFDPHVYDVEVQSAAGGVTTERVTSRHDPKHALTTETVRFAARCQAWLAAGGGRRDVPFPQHAGDPAPVA
jgi:hypothetical protein